MKASLKFREEQNPLIKAKIPLSILSLPFQSTISAGDTKELSLSLSTHFDIGPSFRVSYRPNDSFNPFSLTIKSGIGHYGSPTNAPMTMSAEFNFSPSATSSSNPKFFLHFKPNFGDFSLKRSQSSTAVINEITAGGKSDDDGEMVENPDGGKLGGGYRITSLPLRSCFEGMEIGARTVLPVRRGAVLKMRWGVRFPAGLQGLFRKDDITGRVSPRGVPVLVLNKIGIEHVAEKEKEEKVVGSGVGEVVGSSAELAESCFGVKRQLEMLRGGNASLGKALEELKAEFGSNKGAVVKRKEGDCEGDGEMLKN